MPPSDAPHRLVTFGRLALVDARGFDILSAESGKLLALLAYLAAAPRRRATREHLIDLFWADSPVPKARNALRQSLYKLREALGVELFPAGAGNDVVLGDQLTTDRDLFLAALDSGDYECAIGLHTGPFAPGIVSAGSADFEQWADQERARLQDRFAAAIEIVARRKLDAGQAAHARALANRLLDIDPSDERAWRLRLEAEAASGSRVHLAATIAEVQRRSAAEGRPLKPQTLQLINRVTRRTVPAEPDGGDSTLVADLVGRQTEFVRLHDGWRHATARHPTHLHVTGRAGLGKTRLLEDFAVRLRGEGARVAFVRTTPRQRDVPASMLGNLVAALAELPGAAGIAAPCADILVALQPAIAPRYPNARPPKSSDNDERRRLRLSALLDLIGAVVENGPLCVIMDDAHWWDAESRDTLADATEQLGSQPLLLITAARTSSRDIGSAAGNDVVLRPLSAEQIGALVVSLGEAESAESVVRLGTALAPATDGVPLLVLQALRLGIDGGLLSLANTRWNFARLDEFLQRLHPGAMLSDRIHSLNAAQRDVLLLAAVIEHPVNAADLVSVGSTGPGETLADLERMGFLAAEGGGWRVAHDAIAQAVIEDAPAESRGRTHRVSGILLLSRATSGTARREALRHLFDGGDSLELHDACATIVRQRRGGGDRRAAAAILADAVGADLDPALVQRVVASFPRSLRRRRPVISPSWPIGIAVGAVAVAAAWWASTSPTPPDAELGLLMVSDSAPTNLIVPVRADEWEHAPEYLPVKIAGARERFRGRSDGLQDTPAPAPGGREWLVSRRDSSDLGPTELAVIDSSGVERPLSPAHGDDVLPEWSPDGRSAVFVSTRWSPRDDATFDLGLIDLSTHVVRRLTAGAASDQDAYWSPDGTRIAFLREPATLAPDQLCWITVDGTRSRCDSFGQDIHHVIGWVDATSVLVSLLGPTREMLAIIDVDHRQVAALPIRGHDALISSDGRWVACICGLDQTLNDSATIAIFPTHRPEERRFIRGAAKTGSLQYYWIPGPAHSWIDRLRIVPPNGPVAVDASYQLIVHGTDGKGLPIGVPAPVVTWTSSDTAVVAVDESAGRLRPHKPGSAWIAASAGGWRRDSVRVTIRGPATLSIGNERWDPSWPARWTEFGPPPYPAAIVGTPIGRAVTPGGNGTYITGIYRRQTLPSDAGLGVEATIRTPITRTKWQWIRLGFSTIDSVNQSGPIGDACTFTYPAGEGWSQLHLIEGPDGLVRIPDDVAAGTPWRLRVKLFSDGTCGIALDGKPLFRSTRRVTTTHPYELVVGGESVGTRILVGPLTFWRGVRGDVDWGALDRDTVASIH